MTTMGNGYPSPAILKAFRRKIDPKTGALVEDDGLPEAMPNPMAGSVASTGVIWVGEGASSDSSALSGHHICGWAYNTHCPHCGPYPGPPVMPVCAGHEWEQLIVSYTRKPYERCRFCTQVRAKP